MKKLGFAVLGLVGILALGGCAASTEAKITDGQVKTRAVTLETGEVVDCIFWVPVDSSGFASAEGSQMQCFVRVEEDVQ